MTSTIEIPILISRKVNMKYTYKVKELGLDKPIQDMQAMSFKKLRAKLDHTKEYSVDYTNKKGNFIVTTTKGKEPK